MRFPLAWSVVLAAATLVPGIHAQEAPHGAASMERQQMLLDRWLAEIDVTAAPRGVDPMVWASRVPADNALTRERVSLGRKLYFDLRLSADGTVSCATCHDVTRGFTDQRAVSEGFNDQLGRRNAPTTLNAALANTMFLDGRARDLEHQAGMPILNPIEMGLPSREHAIARIRNVPEYPPLFQAAYGRDLNYDDLERAIAAFERTLIFLDAPFDRFLNGDVGAISADAAKGWELFQGKARCVSCHTLNSSNPLGSDQRFHNIGVAAKSQDFEALARTALQRLEEDSSEQTLDQLALSTDMSELGRFMVTRNRADIGAFRTTALRNIGVTAPYMHDGSLQTLWDVMDHYNKGGIANPFLDGGIEPLALEEVEIDQLVAFLVALTDDRLADQNQQQFEKQRAQAAESRPNRDVDLAMRRTDAFETRIKNQQP